MKILVHIHGYPPNHNAGAEWMVHHMLKWLEGRDCEIVVAVPDPGASEFEGITIVPEYGSKHIRHRYKWADIIISHLDRCGKVINNIREVNEKYGHHIEVLQDLEGYRIRVGQLKQPIDLKPRQCVWISDAFDKSS